MKIVYIDMDDTLFQYKKKYEEALQNNPSIKYPQSQYGFFANLPMISEVWGIRQCFHLFETCPDIDPYILTAPSWKNPMSYTEKRVSIGNNFGDYWASRLIINPNKGLMRGHYLIDDLAEGKGQDKFEGRIIQYGVEPYETWLKIFDYFNFKFRS